MRPRKHFVNLVLAVTLGAAAACSGGEGGAEPERERSDGSAISGDAGDVGAQGCEGVAPLPTPGDEVGAAAVSFYHGPFQEFEVFLMAPDGSDRRLVVEGTNLTSPVLSPAGTLVAYNGFGPHSRDIFVVDSVGESEPSPVTAWELCRLGASQRDELENSSDAMSNEFSDQLTDQLTDELATVETGGVTESDGGAAWSPDGTHLVFESSRLGSSGIFTMNLATGAVTRLIVEADGEDVSYLRPHWSPDGTKIVFVRRVWGAGNGFDIMVMNADGTNPRPVTDNGEVDEDQPQWSPDGTQLLFWSDRDGDQELFVVSVDEVGNPVGDPTQLTFNEVNDNFAVWSPDGTQILFGTQRDGEEEWVWHMQLLDVAGGAVTDLGQQGRPTSWVDPVAG